MSGYSLKIEFSGICTHFTHGVAAGIPHRVVLPDAGGILTGLLTVEREPVQAPVLYYLTPHFPQLAVSENVKLSIEGLIHDGDIRSGIRLQVANAAEHELLYEPGHCAIPKVTEFLPDYNFSSDVVLNGRAACYLDLYGGRFRTLCSDPGNPKGPNRVDIRIETNGPPELLVTSLLPTTENPKSHRLLLAHPGGEPREITLQVMNLELRSEVPYEEGGGSFDYLLHYLTARGGIPRAIAARTPGMPLDGPLPSATQDDIAAALRGMAHLLVPPSPGGTNSSRVLIPTSFLTPSCSDSQYP